MHPSRFMTDDECGNRMARAKLGGHAVVAELADDVDWAAETASP